MLFFVAVVVATTPLCEDEEMIVVVNAIYAILCYEATDVGSRSIVGSYVPVKEISVNDI